jgi:Flp pilus assembly protein TadG
MRIMTRQQTKGPIRRNFLRWRRCEGGAAAVEFGLVAPVLLLVMLGVMEGGMLTLKYNAMRTAVTSGAQYVMGGGTDLDAARAITVSAWSARTNQSSVAATKVCRCGATTANCSILCADQNAPQAFITIAASDRINDGVINQTLSAKQEIRVR